MAVPTDRLPHWTIAVPPLAIAADLLLQGRGGWPVAAGLGLALLLAVKAAVHHAEVVAARLGDPFGAIVLALAVTVIELGLIVSILLGDTPQPTLVRDTVHAVVVLVLHGLAGACILVAAIRHREAGYRTIGAQAYLIVLIPMVSVTLVLPAFVAGTPGPFYTTAQLVFVSAVCLALYLAFTFVQTVRERENFLPARPAGAAPGPKPSGRLTLAALGLLALALGAVVLLAKAVSPFIQAGVASAGAPEALVGVIVAAIVLMPEAATALRAARDDRLQTSINLALGSAVATIGLTIPTVSAIALWTGTPLELGVSSGGAMLLGLSFLMALITYGSGRASLLAGFVHLILLAVWLFLVVAA